MTQKQEDINIGKTILIVVLSILTVFLFIMALVRKDERNEYRDKAETLEKQTEASQVNYAFYEDGSGFIEVDGFKCVVSAFDSPEDHVSCSNSE